MGWSRPVTNRGASYGRFAMVCAASRTSPGQTIFLTFDFGADPLALLSPRLDIEDYAGHPLPRSVLLSAPTNEGRGACRGGAVLSSPATGSGATASRGWLPAISTGCIRSTCSCPFEVGVQSIARKLTPNARERDYWK